MTKAYPLHWPDGWTRTPVGKRRRSPYKLTPEKSTAHLLNELKLLGALRGSIIISSNVPLRRDGLPYANVSPPEDPGVAVYWSTHTFKDRSIVCDKWDRAHDNIHACGLAIAALRAIERAGAGQISDRAFNAFGALPPSSEPAAVKTRPWWEVFGFSQVMLGSLSRPLIDARFRELSVKAHPDKGGSDAAMKELTNAYEQAKAHFT
jgi:hypothetical protein